MMTTQKQVREAFWQAWREGMFAGLSVTPKRNGKMHNTDTRVAFCNFVDGLNKDGQLRKGLAETVTL